MASGEYRPQRYSPGTRVWVERTPGQVVDVDEYGRLWGRLGGGLVVPLMAVRVRDERERK